MLVAALGHWGVSQQLFLIIVFLVHLHKFGKPFCFRGSVCGMLSLLILFVLYYIKDISSTHFIILAKLAEVFCLLSHS